MSKDTYNIICLSNQFFDSPMKTNKWHAMTRLSDAGHNVLFIDPPTRFKSLQMFLKKRISLGQFIFGTRRENDRLTIFTPVNLFNFRPFSTINLFLQLRTINKFINDHKNNPTVLWVYHFDYPELRNLIKKLSYELLIYDCVDEYTAFPEYASNKSTNKGFVGLIQAFDNFFKIRLNQYGLTGKDWVLSQEKYLCEVSDVVFASAPGLVKKFKSMLNTLALDESKVYFLPNAGDYARFSSVLPKENIPKDLINIPHPIIVTAGAIDNYKMDIVLTEMCAEMYPSYSFVLIGPEKLSDPDLDLSKLKSLKNVYFLGQKHYTELPNYYINSDAYFIPYNLNDYTVGGCFPVKFHDALATGLPVIVTNMPAYEPFRQVCYIGNSREEFVNYIDIALKENSVDKKIERQIIAKENSWEGKVKKQLDLIDYYLNKSSTGETLHG